MIIGSYDEKKVFCQLSKKFKLPKDLTIQIYNYIRYLEKSEQDEIRLFYKNLQIFNVIDIEKFPMLSLCGSLLEDHLQEKDPITHSHRSFASLKGDMFNEILDQEKFPSLEKIIKDYPGRRRSKSIYNADKREACHFLLKLFKREDYFCVKSINFDYTNANFKQKIRYLKLINFQSVIDSFLEILQLQQSAQRSVSPLCYKLCLSSYCVIFTPTEHFVLQ
jgi:hypothetical protein